MRKSFWFGTVLVFAAITIVAYLPAFIGRVPFPRDMILQFAAWHDPARSEALQSPRGWARLGQPSGLER